MSRGICTCTRLRRNNIGIVQSRKNLDQQRQASVAMLVKTSKNLLPQVETATHISLRGGSSAKLQGGGNKRRRNGGCLRSSLSQEEGQNLTNLCPETLNNVQFEATAANKNNNFGSEHPILSDETNTIAANSSYNVNVPINGITVLTGRSRHPTPSKSPIRKRSIQSNSSLLTSFGTYCQETSLHGWKYVQTSRSLERFCWLALLIVSLTTASVLVYRAVTDFLSHTVSTNMDSLSTTYDNLYFPAITVCNMNFMQRSVLQKYKIQNNDTLIDIFDRMINTGSKENFTEEEIRMFEDIERVTNGSSRLKMEGQPKCHNMFLQYYWKNKDIPFTDGHMTMHYGQTTDESVCCQIFPGMLPEENDNEFDVTNVSFWLKEPNPWQIIFDGYKKGIKPGKQVPLCYGFLYYFKSP